jgi:hypothetical protein
MTDIGFVAAAKGKRAGEVSEDEDVFPWFIVDAPLAKNKS